MQPHPGRMPLTLFFRFWIAPLLIGYGVSLVGVTAFGLIDKKDRRRGVRFRLALAGLGLVAFGAVAFTMWRE